MQKDRSQPLPVQDRTTSQPLLIHLMAGKTEGTPPIAHHQIIVKIGIGVVAGAATQPAIIQLDTLVNHGNGPQIRFPAMLQTGLFIGDPDWMFAVKPQAGWIIIAAMLPDPAGNGHR